MDLVGRLKSVIAHTNLSNRAFALRCGLNQATIDKQVKGQRSVSADTIVAVCATYPEISRDWFLLGEGEMMINKSKEAKRLRALIDTIALLQETLKAKSKAIANLNERILQLESQTNSK